MEIWRWQNFVLTGVDNTDSIFALEVSEHLFDTLGVRAALGRTFLPGEFDSSAQQVVVISDRLWRKHFRADPSILGRQILLDGEGYIVVGVMGPEFVFTNPAHQAWIPYKPATVVHRRTARLFQQHGRLRPGVSISKRPAGSGRGDAWPASESGPRKRLARAGAALHRTIHRSLSTGAA